MKPAGYFFIVLICTFHASVLNARNSSWDQNDSASAKTFTPFFANVGMGFGDFIAVRYGATMDLYQKFTMALCYTFYAHDGAPGIPCSSVSGMNYCPRVKAHFIEASAGRTFYSKGLFALEAIGGISCTIYDRPVSFYPESYYIGTYGPFTRYNYHYHAGLGIGFTARLRMNVRMFPELGLGVGPFINYNTLYPSAGVTADLLIGKVKRG